MLPLSVRPFSRAVGIESARVSSGSTEKLPLTTTSFASVTPPRSVPPLMVSVPVPSESLEVTSSKPLLRVVPPL